MPYLVALLLLPLLAFGSPAAWGDTAQNLLWTAEGGEGRRPEYSGQAPLPFELSPVFDPGHPQVQVVEESEPSVSDKEGESFGASYDIPIVINDQVKRFIQFFVTRKKEFFTNSLARGNRYLPMMREVFRDNELPEDLAYLALIESGYNTSARSPARAVGQWQFIPDTGRRYGLKVDRWVDERKDPKKSTVAAARYLKDLYNMFGSWFMALAAYNAGELRIQAAVEKHGTDDYWELTRRGSLPRETREFVPKLIAATLIAKEPERYGLEEVDYLSPREAERVKVPPRTPLNIIARASGVSLEEVRSLNPSLVREVTPPGDGYEVRIPATSLDQFAGRFKELAAALERDGRPTRVAMRSYRLRRGDTLEQVAARFRVSVETLTVLNKIRDPGQVKAGRVIRVPVKGKERVAAVAGEARQVTTKYRVKRGDTLYDISRERGVSLKALARANDLSLKSRLRPGMTLIIPGGKSPGTNREI